MVTELKRIAIVALFFLAGFSVNAFPGIFSTNNEKQISTDSGKYRIYNPYAKTKRLTLKGQMHCHTTNSDGKLAPLELCKKYQSIGFDFMTITDHEYITPEPVGNELIWIGNSYENTNGNTPTTSAANYAHICVYDTDSMLLAPNYTKYNSYKSINEVQQFHEVERKEMINLCHPNWSGFYLPDSTMLNCNGHFSFVECWNDGAANDSMKLRTCCRGWDLLLSRGLRVYSLGVDDYHSGNGIGEGWAEVFSNTKSKKAIMSSLAKGDYVAANGKLGINPIAIKKIQLKRNILSVHIEAPATIRFIGKNGKVLKQEDSVTGSDYSITGNELYVRVEIWSGVYAKWLQPYFIERIR